MLPIRRSIHAVLWTALALLPALLLGLPAPAAEPLPIFDAHVHYSQDGWAAYPTEVVISKLADAGVLRGLVSSSPDEGTLALYRADPRRFVPELRPYRGSIGSGNWTRDAETPGYLSGRLALAPYVGLGEFHLFDAQSAHTPTVRQVVALALQHGLLLHVHSDAAPVQAIFDDAPAVRILWAHAGMTSSPEEVRAMVERHANLWVELAFREHDVLRDGGLDPAWRALLVEHSERFLVGSDTYTPSRWGSYGEIIAAHRRYLALLPPEVARAIAYGNAVRLFGAGGAAFPSP